MTATVEETPKERLRRIATGNSSDAFRAAGEALANNVIARASEQPVTIPKIEPKPSVPVVPVKGPDLNVNELRDQVLIVMQEHPKRDFLASEIAGTLNTTSLRISHSLQLLEKQGLISRSGKFWPKIWRIYDPERKKDNPEAKIGVGRKGEQPTQQFKSLRETLEERIFAVLLRDQREIWSSDKILLALAGGRAENPKGAVQEALAALKRNGHIKWGIVVEGRLGGYYVKDGFIDQLLIKNRGPLLTTSALNPERNPIVPESKPEPTKVEDIGRNAVEMKMLETSVLGIEIPKASEPVAAKPEPKRETLWTLAENLEVAIRALLDLKGVDPSAGRKVLETVLAVCGVGA